MTLVHGGVVVVRTLALQKQQGPGLTLAFCVEFVLFVPAWVFSVLPQCSIG